MPEPQVQTELAYPIGKPHYQPELSSAERAMLIDEIGAAPPKLRAAVEDLTRDQLSTPYRPGGWAVSQVVHHVADSHLNAYIRFKWALTEDDPHIKAYDEKLWAQTPEVFATPVEVSLSLLEQLHVRWVILMKTMKADDFRRTLQHPENGEMSLDRILQLYAWHGKHHVAHITELRKRNGW